MFIILRHISGLSANLECRSEMCCTWLSGNAGPKKSPKIHQLGTIAQLRRAISSQLRHVFDNRKHLLNSNTCSMYSGNMVNFSPLPPEICWRYCGTPANFDGFRVLAALLHGTLVVGVSQTLRCWTESATYIRQGGHHVGHWPTFLVFKEFLNVFNAEKCTILGVKLFRFYDTFVKSFRVLVNLVQR